MHHRLTELPYGPGDEESVTLDTGSLCTYLLGQFAEW